MSLLPSALPVALITVCVLLSPATVQAQDADALFQRGFEAYQQGNQAVAVASFKAALATNPGHEQAFRMWQHVEQQVMLEMLVERGELGALAERFLGLAKLGRQEIVSAPGKADDLVSTILSGDELERQRALLELQATFGSWAVPALVGPLGDTSSTENRVLAIQALIRLGDTAVLPLVAVLDSEDETTRRNAAGVLGSLRDPRAAPALAWMARQDEDAVARNAAKAALEKIGLAGTDPQALSAQMAAGYFRGEESFLKPYADVAVLWSLDDGELHGRAVMGGLFALEMAEAYALDALEHGAGGSVRALLAAVHAAQKAEIEAAAQLDALAGQEQLAEAIDSLPDLDVNLALAGNHRGRALDLCRAPASRHPLAALTLMDAMDGGPDEMRALRAALKDPDGTVSLGAAMALARHGVTEPGVVARLSHALASVPDRLVVSIGDSGLRGSSPGWKLLASRDVSAGLLRAKGFPPKDVVVIRDGLQGVTLDTMVFGLRNDPRTADVPIIVVTDDVPAVQSLYGGQVSAVVTTATWTDVNQAAGNRAAALQQALERARRAAEALASLPVQVVHAAAPQISVALGAGADDGLKVAVLRLVQRAGLLDSLSAVERLIADESQATEVRVAGMQAAAHLWALNGGKAAGSDVSGVLLAALETGSPPLAAAAAAALGQLGGVPESAIHDAVR